MNWFIKSKRIEKCEACSCAQCFSVLWKWVFKLCDYFCKNFQSSSTFSRYLDSIHCWFFFLYLRTFRWYEILYEIFLIVLIIFGACNEFQKILTRIFSKDRRLVRVYVDILSFQLNLPGVTLFDFFKLLNVGRLCIYPYKIN